MLYSVILLSLFFIIGIYWAYNQEKKDWNNGYLQCGRYIWISYSIDKFPVYPS